MWFNVACITITLIIIWPLYEKSYYLIMLLGVNLYSSYTLLQINGREHEAYGEVLNVINKLTIMIMMHNSFQESIINEHK